MFKGVREYKLDTVGVEVVRWEKGCTEQAEGYTFFYGAGNEDQQLEISSLYVRENHISS
jgi:hypothetical protein